MRTHTHTNNSKRNHIIFQLRAKSFYCIHFDSIIQCYSPYQPTPLLENWKKPPLHFAIAERVHFLFRTRFVSHGFNNPQHCVSLFRFRFFFAVIYFLYSQYSSLVLLIAIYDWTQFFPLCIEWIGLWFRMKTNWNLFLSTCRNDLA